MVAHLSVESEGGRWGACRGDLVRLQISCPESSVDHARVRLQVWLERHGWSSFDVEELGDPLAWRVNTYAPGLVPLEASVFATDPATVRLAFEPLGWGTPRERLERIASIIPPSLARRVPPEPRFGVFTSLRQDGVRVQRAYYVESVTAPEGEAMWTRLFTRIGLGETREYVSVGRALSPGEVRSAISSFLGPGTAGGTVERALSLFPVVVWPPELLVFSKGSKPGSGKVELRVRPQLDEDDVGRVIRLVLPAASARSLSDSVSALGISRNILSFRVEAGHVVDVGIYGSPKI